MPVIFKTDKKQQIFPVLAFFSKILINFVLKISDIRYLFFCYTYKFSIMRTLLTIWLMPGVPQVVIILVVVLLLFGGKKIPELMKGIGKGVRGFKEGLKEIEDDLKLDDDISK